jgi:Rrf2 family nitric oxide-sensitive transcriptional repressor
MRLTTRTNLAMRALMFCAVNPDAIVRKADIATACNASLNHLGLVINLLGQAGFIETCRGRHGGVKLARPASEISIGAVARLLEGDVPFAECFDTQTNTCPLTSCCRLRGSLARALAAFYGTLDAITLADLTDGNAPLHAMLELDSAA